jgi:hypothetical protein
MNRLRVVVLSIGIAAILLGSFLIWLGAGNPFSSGETVVGVLLVVVGGPLCLGVLLRRRRVKCQSRGGQD